MKAKLQILYSGTLSFLLTLLGFTGCSDSAVEYGTPSALYRVKGKVIAKETKTSVEGIRAVVVSDDNRDNTYFGDTVFTNKQGEFLIETQKYLPPSKLILKLQDVDGEKNGLFDEYKEEIEILKEDLKKKDDWFWGTAEKDMGTIELTSKKEETAKP